MPACLQQVGILANNVTATTMAKQSSLMCYVKKTRLEEEDTPLPPSPESTQHSSSDSLAHSQVSPATCSPAPLLSPSQPAAGLPADLSAIDEPPSQPSLNVFPCTVKNGKSRCFSSKWYGQFSRFHACYVGLCLFATLCTLRCRADATASADVNIFELE